METIVKELLKSIEFETRYINICNNNKDFDNSKTFKKNEVSNILNDLNWVLKYSSKEKIFPMLWKHSQTSEKIQNLQKQE